MTLKVHGRFIPLLSAARADVIGPALAAQSLIGGAQRSGFELAVVQMRGCWGPNNATY